MNIRNTQLQTCMLNLLVGNDVKHCQTALYPCYLAPVGFMCTLPHDLELMIVINIE